MKKKKLPVGLDSFEKLRREDFYYVDKTGLIVELLENWHEVNLFTRPRRFGKTLNMSMLKSFFEIDGNKTIFEGLKVAEYQTLCETYMGQYPVIFLSLKGVDGPSFEVACERLRRVISEEAGRVQYLLESRNISEMDKIPLRKLLEGTEDMADLTAAVRMLCRLLEKHHGQKVILLIDEYDVPLDKAYQHGYYEPMIDLIRSLFDSALKTNSSLLFAVLTGCLRVSKESIFTGLNNLKVYSISDLRYEEYFGFTEQEVKKMLEDYQLSSHYQEVHDWYDGYLFGSQNVYCPWDVINYCDDLLADPQAAPKTYWMNTSGNDMVRRLIDKGTDGTTQMEIERLIAGEFLVKTLNENLTHSEIDANMENIWTLLYMTGYLTSAQKPSEGRYCLRIPNCEVRRIYTSQVLQWFRDKVRSESRNLTGLYRAFETGDAKTITQFLNGELLDTVSFYDAQESFYHGFLLALLNTCGDWRVSSNRETGKGRSDIIVEGRDRRVGFVIEVKDVKSPEKLEDACQRAMRQVEEKDYTAILRRYRVETIWTYAIAFWEKECKVLARKR